MTDYTKEIAKLETEAAELENLIAKFGEDALCTWVTTLAATNKKISALYSERFWGKAEYRKIKRGA
jgi:hypothetical protein